MEIHKIIALAVIQLNLENFKVINVFANRNIMMTIQIICNVLHVIILGYY